MHNVKTSKLTARQKDPNSL